VSDERVSDEPIREAVALAKTVNGFLTATAVKAATDAAIARIAVFNNRDEPPLRALPNFGTLRSPSDSDRKRGTESSGRNSSLVATDRFEWYDRSCDPNSSRSTGSAYWSS